MRRRDLFTVGTLALAASATAAVASETTASADPALNIAGVGLPVIVDGRIRNYVFVSVRLYLGAGQTPETMRAKDPYFRDALVKAAHATPFTLPNDWTQLNAAAISAALVRASTAISGAGSVTRAEVILQTPRRHTGMRRG